MDKKELHSKIVEIIRNYYDQETTAANKILDLFNVTNNEVEYCECGKPTLGTSVSRCGTCNKWFKSI